MAEKAKSIIDIMKEKISESGKKKSDVFWVKKDGSVRVRFLTELTEAVSAKFHEQWKVVNPYPCLEYYGKECPGCEDKDIKTNERYCLTVWNYETKRREPFVFKMNNCSPFPAVVAFYGEYDTICDRDYKIERHGESTDTTYTLIPLTPKKFIGDEVPFTKKQMFKKLLEAFPYTTAADLTKIKTKQEVDDDDDDEDEVPVKKSKPKAKPKYDEDEDDDDDEVPVKKKAKAKIKEVEEDDEDEEDEDDDEPDYESMTGDELKAICKKRKLSYKGLKRKDVIEMLTDDMPF